MQGSINAGFISSSNRVYYKTLKKGDTMVIPKGLLHSQLNVGRANAIFVAGFNSENTDFALFGNELPTNLVSSTTFLRRGEIKRLKRILGGTY